MRLWAMLFVVLCLPAAGCSRSERQEQKPPQESGMKQENEKREVKVEMLNVTSPVFGAGQRIPRKYTGEGENVSPALSWSGAPEGTRQFALICDDPDAPRPEPWVHWVLYGIPPEVTDLAEGSSGGAMEGKNSSGRTGYHGPMPPPGHGTHHYHFKVYALDRPVHLPPGATKKELLEAMKGHVLAEGETVGTYER